MDQSTPSIMERDAPVIGSAIDRWFLAHPRSIGTTYFGHMRGALVISGRMAAASLACLVHAFVPGLFEKAASGTVTELDREFDARRADMASYLGL
ncbi:MAG TPA: DUF6356 family protein [Rhizomicrobium sp.]|nr:DUF6356 family protein [Rhizomicrobium sp.]